MFKHQEFNYFDTNSGAEEAVHQLGDVAMHIGKSAASENFRVAFANAIAVYERHRRYDYGVDAAVVAPKL